MSSSLKNSVLILAFIILLPITIFISFEIGTLNENEKMLEEVYREQLNAVILSVNQYTADLLDFYINQIDYQWSQTENKGGFSDSLFIQQNLAIEGIAVRYNGVSRLMNMDKQHNVTTAQRVALNSGLDEIFDDYGSLTERLIRYKQAGYIKPENISVAGLNDRTVTALLVIIGEKTPCLIFINPVLFIEDLLAPKIQQIATQNVNISVNNPVNQVIIYSNSEGHSDLVQTNQLTILEDYDISVSPQGQSVSALIQERTIQNLISLTLLIVLIVIGVVLVVRNVRREVILNKAKSDFVANVSHEIRTPLALISMFNETLLLGRINDEAKKLEYHQVISKETSRLNNIVNKILTFSQIDANKKTYQLHAIAPDELVEEVLDTYSYHLSEKGFHVESDLKGKTNILADKEAFIEVIINLMDNALKYSSDEKILYISSSIIGANYVLAFKDKGIGISKKDQKRIFEKFYRAEGGDIHNTKGTGLGLSLVKEIMDAHKGAIEVESTLNHGTTFTLKFPING